MSEPVLSWPDFLVGHGAAPAPDGSPDRLAFPMPATARSGFAAPLTHLGVISATGDDAANFLHNQLTNDVLGLSSAHARLAGYCSAKGRLLATLLVWTAGDDILMVLPRSLLPSILKRLQMFVLRAKVKLEDASERLALIGVAAPPGALARLPAADWQRADSEAGTLIRLPAAAGLQRALWAGPATNAALAWQRHSDGLAAAPASLWRWTEIMAGLPQVVEATREQFVPQMINFELVGGVNFRKGCYPGQEIVARSQYLGKLKRRALLAYCDDESAAAGIDIYSEADPSQPAGMVVNAERGPDGRIACLVEVKMDTAETPLHVGSPNGPRLTLGELPYSLAAVE